MASKPILGAIREAQPLARDLRDADRVLPILQVGDFQFHVEEYRNVALGIVLPVFQRLYDERIEKLDSSGLAAGADARLHVHDTIESAEQTTTKAIAVALENWFDAVKAFWTTLHEHLEKLVRDDPGLHLRLEGKLVPKSHCDRGAAP